MWFHSITRAMHLVHLSYMKHSSGSSQPHEQFILFTLTIRTISAGSPQSHKPFIWFTSSYEPFIWFISNAWTINLATPCPQATHMVHSSYPTWKTTIHTSWSRPTRNHSSGSPQTHVPFNWYTSRYPTLRTTKHSSGSSQPQELFILFISSHEPFILFISSHEPFIVHL
jgi:hypothetical protein